MITSTITICNKAGLHARAASRMVSVTSTFRSAIKVGADKLVDGKSILALMMLAAAKGSTINIETSGDKEREAMDAIVALINDYFGEGA